MFFRMGGCRNSNREVFMSWVFPLHTPGHRSQWEDLKPAKPKREAVCTTLLQQASRSMASCNVEKEQLGQIYLHLWQMKLSQIWVSTSYMEHLDIGYCKNIAQKQKHKTTCEIPAFHLLFCIAPFGSPMKVTIGTPSPCLVILLLLLLGFKQTGSDVMRTYGNMEKHGEFETLFSGIQWHIVGISLVSPVAFDQAVSYVAVPFSGSV